MAKFNTGTVRPATSSPVTSEHIPSARTYEGAPGHARDTKSELFLLAVANMVGESTFYETGPTRDDRYARLVATCTVEDPGWTARLLGWLRGEGNLRSASIAGTAEYVHARLAAGPSGPNVALVPIGNRAVIDSVLQRADEPGELLAYWTSRFGRAVPKPVKRGVADAAVRLYNERSLLKYDSDARGYRFGDVLELTHPAPKADWQGELFRYAIDRRHNRDNPIPESLEVLRRNEAWSALAANGVTDAFLNTEGMARAGITWERALSAAGDRVDKAKLWSALIPTMGYMALLRNLRNFDEAGVPDEVAATLAARFADPEQVAKSRQFPFRFWAAYKHAPSLRWAHALETALGHSLANVPSLKGRTLVLVDRSPSMFPGYYFSTQNRGDIPLADQAAVFGAAVALRAESADLVQYGATNQPVNLRKGGSVLRLVEQMGMIDGTDTARAVKDHYRGHDRVLIVTDEQTAYSRYGTVGQLVPAHVPVYTWNLAGYQPGHGPSGGRNRHTFGGLSDAAFRMVPLLEAGGNADWPF